MRMSHLPTSEDDSALEKAAGAEDLVGLVLLALSVQAVNWLLVTLTDAVT